MPLSNKYKSITIERKTGTQWGGESWQDITSATDKGYIQPITGNENFDSGKAGEKVEYRMYVPMENTDVQYQDRITQDGQKYIVIFSIQPVGISAENHHKEILLGAFK